MTHKIPGWTGWGYNYLPGKFLSEISPTGRHKCKGDNVLMKKVLGIVISDRRLGNSEVLVKEIMSSIPGECGRELIRLTDFKIEPCKACYRCLQPHQDCAQKDDFNYLMGKIMAADALIIGVPVYILGPHGYYKMLMDRLVGVGNYIEQTRGKPCALVIPYGTIGWTGYTKAASMIMPRLLNMKIVDCWQVHATLPGESLLDSDNIEYARKLGQDLFSDREYIPGNRECCFCGSDILRLLADNRVECPICGAKGRLDHDNIPNFTDADYFRFSAHQVEEHFKGWVKEMKSRFAVEKDKLKEAQKDYRDKDWWIRP